jgi:type III pantothenate kinase
MLLALDVGNTHTVIGVYEGSRLHAHWRIGTSTEVTADELGVLLSSLFRNDGVDPGRVLGMIVSSVVPDIDPVLRKLARAQFDVDPLFVEPGIRTGVPIRYDNPHEVGADRIVNAVAAVSRYGAPVIVLDFGTATTFDVVSPQGEYVGGVIAPGLGISADALFDRAARLARVDVRKPAQVIGRNTMESMQSGLFHGYASLVEGILERIQKELGAQAPVVATGGLAHVFENDVGAIETVSPDLALEGLRLIWKKNVR